MPFAPGYRMNVQGTQCQIDGLRNLLCAIGISQGKQWVCRGTVLSQLPNEANGAFRRRVYLAILRSRKLDAPFDILERVAKRHMRVGGGSLKEQLEHRVKTQVGSHVSKSASAEGNHEDKGTDALDGTSDFAEVECELQALDYKASETCIGTSGDPGMVSEAALAWALRWVPPCLPLGECPSMSKAKGYAATTICAWQCRLCAARWALECPWQQQTVFLPVGAWVPPLRERSDMEAYQRSWRQRSWSRKRKKRTSGGTEALRGRLGHGPRHDPQGFEEAVQQTCKANGHRRGKEAANAPVSRKDRFLNRRAERRRRGAGQRRERCFEQASGSLRPTCGSGSVVGGTECFIEGRIVCVCKGCISFNRI